ncbi:MAG: hypothetical protein H5T72_04300 [Actinobacteria bacterium]|nr:hypothetical protein [Actinomycetota bacterium]
MSAVIEDGGRWVKAGSGDQARVGMNRGSRLRAAFLAPVALLLACAATGCRGGRTPAEWLQDCYRSVQEYAGEGGYLRFRQEAEYVVETGRGALTDTVRVEGEIVLPEVERYDYREEVRSDIGGERGKDNSFSYLTLDGGKSAYVKGERLAETLGVEGWVHYVPREEQDRYFDFLKLVEKATTAARDPQWMGLEETAGVRCAHLAFDLSGRDMLEMRSQEGSSLLQEYGTLDPEWLNGELRVELWIGEENLLPVQLRLGTRYDGGDFRISYALWVVFEGYGERPLLPIERPGAYVEAE